MTTKTYNLTKDAKAQDSTPAKLQRTTREQLRALQKDAGDKPSPAQKKKLVVLEAQWAAYGAQYREFLASRAEGDKPAAKAPSKPAKGKQEPKAKAESKVPDRAPDYTATIQDVPAPSTVAVAPDALSVDRVLKDALRAVETLERLPVAARQVVLAHFSK